LTIGFAERIYRFLFFHASFYSHGSQHHTQRGKDNSGYNQGLRDAAKVIYDCKEAQMVAVKGRDIGDLLAELIEQLEKK